ncbi:MAG: MMPL family transporter, partial [Pseudomonadota bacterium]
ERLVGLREALSKLPFGADVTITGLTVLLADEFPKLIGELRFGLLASVILVITMVAIATRSAGLALACVVPNLLPVLFSQGLIWAAGSNLSLTNVVALTIGFGIAIDNSVHVINAYKKTQGTRETTVGDVRAAISSVAPALFSGTAILCLALGITLFSAMPAIGQLGGLLIATLVAALISNIVILPSAMIVILGNRHAARRVGPV